MIKGAKPQGAYGVRVLLDGKSNPECGRRTVRARGKALSKAARAGEYVDDRDRVQMRLQVVFTPGIPSRPKPEKVKCPD